VTQRIWFRCSTTIQNQIARLHANAEYCPAIPYRSNTKDIPAFFPDVHYKGRARLVSFTNALPVRVFFAMKGPDAPRHVGFLHGNHSFLDRSRLFVL
jgi:hypothetical protein